MFGGWIPEKIDEIKGKAKEDLEQFKSLVMKGALRKSTAKWGIPLELIRMAIAPSYKLKETKCGIGHKKEKLHAPECKEALLKLFGCVRARHGANEGV